MAVFASPSGVTVEDLVKYLHIWKAEGYLKIGVWRNLSDVIEPVVVLPNLIPNHEREYYLFEPVYLNICLQ